MKIKASSINNLTDARYFAAWNVEWLGFSLDSGQANYTSPADIKEIKDWLVGPKIVGEFGLIEDKKELITAIEMLELDAVQLSHYTDTDFCKDLGEVLILKEWIAESIDNLQDFEQLCQKNADLVDYFYLNLEKNKIDWLGLKANESALKLLRSICEEYPVIIDIDCPAQHLREMIDTVAPHGLSWTGGDEEQVGVKSFDDLDEIYDVLEEMDLLF